MNSRRPSRTNGLAAVSWTPQEELDFKDWVKAGRRFGVVSRCSQWWVGDWLQYGNQKWGEKYSEASKITGYDPKTLRNMAWVASQFDPSLRSDKLSWSHHVLLAPLEDDEKRAWITRALEDRLSVADLRIETKAALRRERGPADPGAHGEGEAHVASGMVRCPHCGEEIDLTGKGTVLLEAEPSSDD